MSSIPAKQSITCWATGELARALSGLQLSSAPVTTSGLGRGFISGEVTVGERKGKCYPIYLLQVELPWACDGCSGVARMPDISLEMIDDLEVHFEASDGSTPAGFMQKSLLGGDQPVAGGNANVGPGRGQERDRAGAGTWA